MGVAWCVALFDVKRHLIINEESPLGDLGYSAVAGLTCTNMQLMALIWRLTVCNCVGWGRERGVNRMRKRMRDAGQKSIVDGIDLLGCVRGMG